VNFNYEGREVQDWMRIYPDRLRTSPIEARPDLILAPRPRDEVCFADHAAALANP